MDNVLLIILMLFLIVAVALVVKFIIQKKNYDEYQYSRSRDYP